MATVADNRGALEQTGNRHRSWKWPVFILVAVLVAGFYVSGRLDYALYPVGLNLHACARNGFGATFCGADLTAYENRVRGVQRSVAAAQQQAATVGQQATAAECQADPSLSFCPQP